jgi:hypothetical protein
MVVYAFVAGFFGRVILEHSTSPEFQRSVEVAVVIIALVAVVTGGMSRHKDRIERPRRAPPAPPINKGSES